MSYVFDIANELIAWEILFTLYPYAGPSSTGYKPERML